MDISTPYQEYNIQYIHNLYAAEYLLYMDNVNIIFDKNNINNNNLNYILENSQCEYIRKYRNIIVNCFEIFINNESSNIINQTYYFLFDYYNMPLLKITNIISHETKSNYCVKVNI